MLKLSKTVRRCVLALCAVAATSAVSSSASACDYGAYPSSRALVYYQAPQPVTYYSGYARRTPQPYQTRVSYRASYYRSAHYTRVAY